VKFGPLPVTESDGVFLAHAVRRSGLTLKKGQWIGAGEIAALQAAGVSEIITARIEPGEVGENEAALRVAQSLAGPNLRLDAAFTGRCNLTAERSGLVIVDADAIDRVNMVDESITVATLKPYQRVVAGEMVATIKIIPYAAPGAALQLALASVGPAPLRIAPFRALRVGVASTLLPILKPSAVAKALRALEERLAPAGSAIVVEERVAHESAALAGALRRIESACDLIVIFGASSITDRRDVIPSAIETAGGRVEHFGMPVDPGNLLLLGSLAGAGEEPEKPVIGAPSCARSPKENGFDFVLNRLLAGVPLRGKDIKRMGVGGLLTEISSRPLPRALANE
jgi:molybdenum cofactor cytidylyltransferase